MKRFSFILLFLSLTAMSRAQPDSISTPAGPATISSTVGYFNMNSRTATYVGAVRVDDPEMKLRCEWLAAAMPPAGRINHIVCETNVVIDTDQNGQTNHITADKAVYDFAVQSGVTNETITFTGSPRIDNAQAIITGEPIVWNRTTGDISVTGEHSIFKQGIGALTSPTNGPAKLH